MDISKCFSESLGIRDNEIRLYINGEQFPGWDLTHAEDDVNPHILRLLEGTFWLDVAQLNVYTFYSRATKENFKQRLFYYKTGWEI